MKNTRTGLLIATAGILSLALPLASPVQSRASSEEAVRPPFHDTLMYPVTSGKGSVLPGATLVPDQPIFDFQGVPGWIQGKKYTNDMGVTIPKYEILVVKGSRVNGDSVTIPAGGVYFDASPARGEIPMTGSADYFLGKKYYFVDYRAHIIVRKNAPVDTKHWTAVGNHLYRLLSPPVPKVIPNPVLAWRTYDGVSIRPWAVTQRWQDARLQWADQTPMTYLQGVIAKSEEKSHSVLYRTLTGTAISKEWWASRKDFFGEVSKGQSIRTPDGIVKIEDIRSTPKGRTVSLTVRPRKGMARRYNLQDFRSPMLPESQTMRRRMIAIDGPIAVVLWPKGSVSGQKVKIWIYGNVREWKTNASFGGLKGWNYFPIACPIAHHIGGMIYNSHSLSLRPGESIPLAGRYGWLKLVSVQGQKVQFEVGSHHQWTSLMTKSGNLDSVFGEGRAVHGILGTIDSTRLDLDRSVTTLQNR